MKRLVLIAVLGSLAMASPAAAHPRHHHRAHHARVQITEVCLGPNAQGETIELHCPLPTPFGASPPVISDLNA